MAEDDGLAQVISTFKSYEINAKKLIQRKLEHFNNMNCRFKEKLPKISEKLDLTNTCIEQNGRFMIDIIRNHDQNLYSQDAMDVCNSDQKEYGKVFVVLRQFVREWAEEVV